MGKPTLSWLLLMSSIYNLIVWSYPYQRITCNQVGTTIMILCFALENRVLIYCSNQFLGFKSLNFWHKSELISGGYLCPMSTGFHLFFLVLKLLFFTKWWHLLQFLLNEFFCWIYLGPNVLDHLSMTSNNSVLIYLIPGNG